MFATRARLLIVTLWVGSLWTISYIVAPALFVTLADRVLAGTIAGSLFRIEAWLSLACGFVLLVMMKGKAGSGGLQQGKRPVWIIIAMLACTLIGYFGLQPFMAALREAAGPAGVMASSEKLQFGLLHGAASVLYLLQSLLGAGLVLQSRH